MKISANCRIELKPDGVFIFYPNPFFKNMCENSIKDLLVKTGDVYKITLEEPPENFNDKYMNIFHAVRDRIAEFHGESKNKTKEDLKREFGVQLPDGELKSLRDYSNGEWISLIRGTLTFAWELGIDAGNEAAEFRSARTR